MWIRMIVIVVLAGLGIGRRRPGSTAGSVCGRPGRRNVLVVPAVRLLLRWRRQRCRWSWPLLAVVVGVLPAVVGAFGVAVAVVSDTEIVVEIDDGVGHGPEVRVVEQNLLSFSTGIVGVLSEEVVLGERERGLECIANLPSVPLRPAFPLDIVPKGPEKLKDFLYVGINVVTVALDSLETDLPDGLGLRLAQRRVLERYVDPGSECLVEGPHSICS